MIRGWHLAAAVVTIACWSSSARAAPGDATRLEYARSARAAHCPDQDALKSAVAKRLGYNPFFPAARQSIVVEITDAEYGDLRAQMHLINEQGMIVGSSELRERVEHCDELVASLALAISIALDPSAALGAAPDAAPADPQNAAPREPNQEAEEAQNTEPLPAKPLVPAVPKARPHAVASNANGPGYSLPLVLRASGFVAHGTAPATAVGWRVGAGAHFRWFKAVLELADQLPASRRADGTASARASLWQGTLAPCVTQDGFAGCALLNIGALQSEGQGIPNASNKSTTYAAVGVRLEYAQKLVGVLHLLLNADAVKSLTPITLRLRGESVWATPFASFAAGVGLELQFP